MAIVNTKLKLELVAKLTAKPPYKGASSAEVRLAAELRPGNREGQADAVYQTDDETVVAEGTTPVELWYTKDPHGAELYMSEVVVLILHAPASNPGRLEFKWSFLSDSPVFIAPGATLALVSPELDSYLLPDPQVAPAFEIDNPSNAEASFQLTVVGRTLR